MSTHQLQVNNSGAWKTVVSFDGSDEAKKAQIWQAVQALEEASSSSQNWRIASCDRHPVVQAHMGKHTYGVWIAKKEKTA